jgi:hypothetical protein
MYHWEQYMANCWNLWNISGTSPPLPPLELETQGLIWNPKPSNVSLNEWVQYGQDEKQLTLLLGTTTSNDQSKFWLSKENSQSACTPAGGPNQRKLLPGGSSSARRRGKAFMSNVGLRKYVARLATVIMVPDHNTSKMSLWNSPSVPYKVCLVLTSFDTDAKLTVTSTVHKNQWSWLGLHLSSLAT